MRKSLCIKFITMLLSVGLISVGLVSTNRVSASESSNQVSSELAEKRKKAIENQREICIAECEDILNNHPERLPSNLFKNMKVYGVTKENLDFEARDMFEKCKPFFDKVKDIKNEDDYKNAVREVMGYKNGRVNQTIRSLSAEEFEKLVAEDGWVQFFHGEKKSTKQRAEELRKGVPAVADFDTGNNVGCYAMYNAPYVQKAACWAYGKDDDELLGEVVRLAINSNAILIDQDDLMRVFKRMIELYPDYFKDYLKLIKERGEYFDLGYTLHPNFDYFANFVKERTGFDFFANVDGKLAKERYDELEKEYIELVGLVKKEDCLFESLPVESLSEKQKQARADLIKLMKQHPYYCPGLSCVMELDQVFHNNAKGGSLLFNPVLRISRDQGLLTKLWGKDVHFRIDNKMNDGNLREFLDKVKTGKADFGGTWILGGIFDVVNFENVVVCADEFKIYEKLGLS